MRRSRASSEWVADIQAAEDRRIKSGLAFPDGANLLTLLDELVLRSRRYCSDLRLPFVYLMRGTPEVPDPLDGIGNRIAKSTGQRIPYGRISGGAALPDNPAAATDQFVGVLDQAARALSGEFKNVAELHFPRYGLARWLWAQVESPQPVVDPDRVWKSVDQRVRDYVRGRYPASDRGQQRVQSIQSFPWPVQVVAWLPLVALLLMRTVWRPLRWLAGRRMNGQDSFSGLVQQLTELRRDKVDLQLADRFRRLLVDAFLADLGNAYRRTTVFGVGRRRTTYPVLMVDEVADGTVGLELLRQLDGARCAVRERPSPLLVIATGPATAERVVGARADDEVATYTAANARSAYATWRAAVAGSGSFVLPLSLPPGGHEPAYDPLLRAGLPRGRRPATALLLAAVVVAVLLPAFQVVNACGTLPWQSDLKKVDGPNGTTQCVGLAPPGYRYFDDVANAEGVTAELRDQLEQIERLIADLNRQAVQREGYATVVFFGSLSPTDSEGYRTELEELRGLVAFQSSRIITRPIELRLANAGSGMTHAEYAAKAIVKEAMSNDRLVAVVGLGTSKEETRQAMLLLANPKGTGQDGIPMVGTLLSATRIANSTSYYHQVAPTNARQAELVAGHARSIGATKVHIYYSGDPADIYSSDLREQTELALDELGIAFDAQPYRLNDQHDGVEVGQLGIRACQVRAPEVVFYAGRAERFERFLTELNGSCQTNPPHVIAGDDLTGFVLDGKLASYPRFELEYVSFASNLVWGPTCSDPLAASPFFVEYDKLFGDGSACTHTRDSHAILSYDALLTVARGIDNAGLNPTQLPSRDRVLAGIEKIQPGDTSLAGASGQIAFAPADSIPLDKAILLLRASGTDVPDIVTLCGTLANNQSDPGNTPCPLTS